MIYTQIERRRGGPPFGNTIKVILATRRQLYHNSVERPSAGFQTTRHPAHLVENSNGKLWRMPLIQIIYQKICAHERQASMERTVNHHTPQLLNLSST